MGYHCSNVIMDEMGTQITSLTIVPLTKSKFFYGNCELKIAQCYKYLGTHIDENLSFAEHSDAIARLRVQEPWVGSVINYTILKNVGAPHLLSYIPPVYVPFSITAQLSGETRNLSKSNKSNCELYGIFWASTILPPHQCCWVTRAGWRVTVAINWLPWGCGIV